MNAPNPINEFTCLEQQAARHGMRLAVDHIDGHWRAGFVTTDEGGEAVFTLHASGPDEGTAIRRLAKLAANLR